MPSSLVFVIVVGVWAAYAVQHWMRRREHLLTARNVDAFSEALRVLERRPESGSTGASTTGSARAEVAPLPLQPGLSMARAGAIGRSGHGLRLAALAGSVGLLVVTALLATFGVVSVMAPVVAGVVVAGCLGWLRWSASKPAATRSVSATTVAAAPAAGEFSTDVESAPVFVAQPTSDAGASASEQTAAPAEKTPAAPRLELFDVRAYDEPVVAKAAPVIGPGEWMPTPVPRPTYAMKASVAAPATTAPVVATPALDEDAALTPIDIDDEFLAVAPIRNVG